MTRVTPCPHATANGNVHPCRFIWFNLIYNHVVIFEVGVGPIETCRSMSYWNRAECVLFEPAVPYYNALVQATSSRPNVKVHNIAIYDYDGYCNFIENGQISYIEGINSPQRQFGVQGGNNKKCKCAKLSNFDKGNIDLLLLDMEGTEWFALKHLISRPKEIVVETELSKAYKNPFLKEIHKWMHNHNYRKVNTIMADTVWRKTHKMFL